MKNHRVVIGGMLVIILAIASGCGSTPKLVTSTPIEFKVTPKQGTAIPTQVTSNPPGISIPTQVTSNPPGATITLDGQRLGLTPLATLVPKKPRGASRTGIKGTAKDMKEALDRSFQWQKAAYYVFQATKDGFKSGEQSFFVDDGIPSVIHFDLQPVNTRAKR